MRAIWIAVGVAAWLAACGGVRPSGGASYFDLGDPPGEALRMPNPGVSAVEVRAPSWLASSALQYRLLYRDNRERQSYVESRLAAPPAELLEHFLRRRLLAGDGTGQAAGCRLRIDLDEFVQVFDGATASRGVVEARARLLAPAGGALVARRSFTLSRPAATPDARGGIAALSGAAEALAQGLRDWLVGLDRGISGGLNTIERCRGAT